jgi:RNA ligase (TIGR02306 family)
LVSKTDEMNLASKVRALDEIQGLDVYITQKIEGSSITIIWDEENDELMVCSRNNQIGEHETNKFWQAVNKYNLKDKLKAIPKLVLQAELASPGVQKNKLGLTEPDLFVFNVSDKDSRERFGYEASVDMCSVLGIPFVPEVKVVFGFTGTFDELQELADIQVYANGEKAEGIVVRPMTPFFSRVLKDVWSVKVLNREYKL